VKSEIVSRLSDKAMVDFFIFFSGSAYVRRSLPGFVLAGVQCSILILWILVASNISL